MNILCLDLGAKTGWAVGNKTLENSGTKKLSSTTRKDVEIGRKFNGFDAWLLTMIASRKVGKVYFEDVKNHKGVLASHAFGGYLAVLQMRCGKSGIQLEGVGVGTIKKHFTGHGKASKQMMIDEAIARGHEPIDDNEADAIALFYYVLEGQIVNEK